MSRRPGETPKIPLDDGDAFEIGSAADVVRARLETAYINYPTRLFLPFHFNRTYSVLHGIEAQHVHGLTRAYLGLRLDWEMP